MSQPPSVNIQRDAASMLADPQTGAWVFTLDCGHTATPSTASTLLASGQIECVKCEQLVTSGSAIPNP